jgi:ABC-type uncharacterized transport system fused permease/ATPase subunit
MGLEFSVQFRQKIKEKKKEKVQMKENSYSPLGNQPPKQTKFDLLFVRRLLSLFRIQFDRWTALIFFIFILTSFFQVWVVSFTGQVTGGFYQVILTKDITNFRLLLIKAFLVVIGSSILDAVIKMLIEVFQWKTRKQLCMNLHQQYFKNRNYYKINCLDTEIIDNP